MIKKDFNQEWTYKHLGESGEGIPVTLPHDAMTSEKRSMKSRGIHNIGWFESSDYVYQKNFVVSEEERSKSHVLEFEGVYHNAEVYVNGHKAMERPYGYTNFWVDLDSHLVYGEENEIRVIARNADQPNSRWYTGSGMYRPVWMYVGEKTHIIPDSVKIHTTKLTPVPSHSSPAPNSEAPTRSNTPETPDTKLPTAHLQISAATSAPGTVTIRIFDARQNKVAETTYDNALQSSVELQVEQASLWSPESPTLYTCEVSIGEDVHTETFGIRTLTWDREQGLSINGKHVILKGACIHHDNGVLGACAFPEAEERKIRILMENGYNAIRSAHNPCSKAMLDACDRLGMLVMDEYTDMWYIHKNKYDYASYMQDWWSADLRDMVNKDYNHPSVILYSTGNEVAETGQERGIQLTGQMTEYLHSLDATRPVTCGINIFFNALYSLGFGVYSDDKAGKEAAQAEKGKKKKTVGSEFYNTLAGMFGDKTMKLGATLHLCDVKTRDAYANMDVAGYNYGIFRYRKDLKKYPDRLILGSETFCRDAYAFYELAKKEPRIIGDFVWAGMDYIGEAGIGAWEYEDYAPKNAPECGWLTAGSGRVDILGFTGGEAAYTKVALEEEAGPLMAVKPVYQKGKHSPSAWKMTDAMPSWTWPGCEGDEATVEVYARAESVKLYLNGKCVGRKKMKNDCRAIFRTKYQPGKLVAVSYDAKGTEIGRCRLRTASEDTRLTITPEKRTAAPGELVFVRLEYTDKHGIWKPMEKHDLHVTVENGTLLGFGNACSYNQDGYWNDHTRTYYGRALAVIRADENGEVRAHWSDESQTYELSIPASGDETAQRVTVHA